jgi:anaerobic nitric oxide reductase flavorubredoxin
MQPVEIRPDIYWIGVNDHKTDLFEGLWQIQKEGVSYNSYLIKDEKTAIIDLTKELFTDTFLDQIKHEIDLSKVNYIIVNHVEPDHASSVNKIRDLMPQATILCTERARKMLNSFYGTDKNIQCVEDGQTISLGKHSLLFVHTPNVHWPETMMTYEQSEQILFSCDAFGGYKSIEDSIFDDDRADLNVYIREALRYYSNIVANHSNSVRKALTKLADIPVKIVAPSHGLVWRKTPEKIIQLYKTWADYGESGGESQITILYGSMYGNSNKLLEQVIAGIKEVGVPYEAFDVAREQISYLLPALWQNKGVLVSAPTYEAALFPPMTSVLQMAIQKKAFNKKAARIGSYGWAGGAHRTFESLVNDLRWEALDSFDFVGVPKTSDLSRGYDFGVHFANMINNHQY